MTNENQKDQNSNQDSKEKHDKAPPENRTNEKLDSEKKNKKVLR